jgi:excisionase family DNA binding protein
MTIHIIGLQEAAKILRMTPEGVRRKAIAGEIPGSKPGKRWCFIEEDLVQYLRTLYTNNAKAVRSEHHEEKSLWHSVKETTFGGLGLPTVVIEYKKALGLPIKSQRNASTTSSKQVSGKKNS